MQTSPVRSRLALLAAAALFSTGGAAFKAVTLTAWQVAGARSAVAVVVLLLAIPEARGVLPFFVFPNPTANKIFIDCYEQNSFYELHDLSGKLLLRDNISTKKFAIDLQDFESGIYILSVYNKQKQSHLKIIRQ